MTRRTKIPKFRRFVLQNFPFIEQDFDALTDYELICKVVEYLNQVIQSQNAVLDEVEEFETNMTADFNRLEGLFDELESFVNNYFDNLDVQEEINNKLEQMADDGTLQSIIYDYLNSVALFCYDTVADMKLVNSFVNGSFAKTMGYYSKDDFGGATYMIRTKTEADTADEMTLIDLADENLIAELVLTPEMNVKQFGAKGDGTNDDTANIQCAMNNSSTVLIPAGTYMINAVTELHPKSGNRIILDNDATLKAITNDATSYRIFHFVDVQNVELCGGTLEGDRLTHTGLTGEWGNCIRVYGTSHNIYIHDMTLKNPWGDCLGVVCDGDVRTARLHSINARRNGYSIGRVNNFVSNDDIIEGTNGTAPQCGVDIEPDDNSDYLNNVVFNNLRSLDNASAGFMCYMARSNETPYHIELNGLKTSGNTNGVWFETNNANHGETIINNLESHNENSRGIFIRLRGTGHQLTIYRPYVNTYGLTNENAAGIEVQADASEASGNLQIIEPTILNRNPESNNARGVYLQGNVHFSNIMVINPVDLDGGGIGYNSQYGENINFKDNYDVLTVASDQNEIFGGTLYSTYDTINYTSQHTVRLSSSSYTPVGTEVTIINRGDYGVKLYAQNQYVYGLSSAVNKTFTTTDKGAYIKVRRISATEWTVVTVNGTWASN